MLVQFMSWRLVSVKAMSAASLLFIVTQDTAIMMTIKMQQPTTPPRWTISTVDLNSDDYQHSNNSSMNSC